MIATRDAERDWMLRLSSLVGDRTLFRDRSYRRFWLAQQLSTVGVSALVYSMFLMIERETGSAFFGNLFAATYIGPAALLVTVSGALTDHLPKRSVLVAGYIAWAALAAGFAMTAEYLWAVYPVAVAFAIVSQVKGAASSSARPLLVPKAQLERANALGQLGGILAQGVGVLLLPLLFLHTLGAAALAAVCVPLFLLAALEVAQIRRLGGKAHHIRRALRANRSQFAGAWRDLMDDRVSHLTVWFYVLASVTSYVVITLVPRFASDVLGLPEEFGVFIVLPAVAGVWLALRFGDAVIRRLSPLPAVVISFGVLAGGSLLLGFVPLVASKVSGLGAPLGAEAMRIAVTAALGVGIGFGYMFVNVADSAIINARMPEGIQGRVFSGQSVLGNLAAIPPILLAGVGADVLGVAPVLVATALICGGIGAYILARYGLARAILAAAERAQVPAGSAPGEAPAAHPFGNGRPPRHVHGLR